MGGTPNVAGMIADPDFQGLSPADKRAKRVVDGQIGLAGETSVTV